MHRYHDSTPPLIEGDSLNSDEFLFRWEAMPDLARAELIDGIVSMPSHSCPKQSLSSGFPQSNPLICSGVGSHQKTRSTTACAYPVQDTDRRGDGGRGTEGAQTWRCTGFPWLSTRAEVAPTGHSLSKTRLAKSCFGQDCSIRRSTTRRVAWLSSEPTR